MTGRIDQFAVIDFCLMDHSVAEKFRSLEEVLKPVLKEFGGDKEDVKLTKVCQDPKVAHYFQTVMGGAFWDFADFASYFHARSDTFVYDHTRQVLRMRGVEDKVGQALKRAKTPAEAAIALLKTSNQDISWLPCDAIKSGLRSLSGSQPSAQSSGCKDAQIKLLSLLEQMSLAKKIPLAGLISIWEDLTSFGGDEPDADVRSAQEEAMDAVADCAGELIQTEKFSNDCKSLSVLLDMQLEWDTCAETVCQKAQQFIAKQPLENLVRLIRKAATAKAGKFGECLATSAMMKMCGAEPTMAADTLDAMVSGGFGVEGVPMMLRMLLPKVPAESTARVVAGLAEHGASGSDFDACWEATVAEGTLESLPLVLRERIYAQRKARGARERSRSRDRSKQ